MSNVILKLIKYNGLKIALLYFWQLILYLTLWLNGVEVEKISYALFLPIVAFGIYTFFYLGKEYYKHKELENLKKNIDTTLDNLPVPKSLLEEDFENIIEKVFSSKNDSISLQKNKYRDIEDYVTRWTHQIKTPLTGLQLVVSGMEFDNKEEFKGKLFEIEQYCDMLLQYLRLGSESNDYLFEKYKVKSMVNQVVKYYARIFINKGLSVKIDIDENKEIVIDEKWFVFALKQIVSNALKYTHSGSICIFMENEKSICVQDTGIGISQEDLPRICEKGYTGYNGRKDKKATGLGLFLVNDIVNKMSGKVRIESEEDVGTKVYLDFN